MTGLGDEILWPLLRATALLAVSAVLVQGLIWWLRPTSPRIQRAGWFLVLLQGVVLFHLPVRLAWVETRPPQPPATTGADFSGIPDEAPPAVALPPPSPATEPPATDLPAVGLSQPTPPAEPAESFPWASLAVIVWLAGVVCLPLRAALAYVRFLWRLRSSRPAPESWVREWQTLLTAERIGRPGDCPDFRAAGDCPDFRAAGDCPDFRAAKMGLSPSHGAVIPLRVTHDIGPAMCWTPRGYRVFVPERIWAELSATQREAVLRHELAHLRRGDLWLTLLARLLALPHWFNPFAWWAVYRFVECAEWACDHSAAGPRRANATDYAKALLHLGAARPPFPSCATTIRGGSLFVRTRRVLSAQLSEDTLMKKAMILLAAGVLVALSVVRVELVAKEPEADEPQQPGASSPEATLQAARAKVPAEETTIVTGRVLDPDGRPVADAQVGVVGESRRPHRGGDLSDPDNKTLGVGKTDSEGRVRMGIPRISSAGFRTVEALAVATGYGMGWQPLGLDVQEPEVVIRLQREQIIRGRVVDSQGQPAAGAGVYVTWVSRLRSGQAEGVGPRGPREQFPAWPEPAKTDDQGRFAIRGVSRQDTVELRVSDHRFATWDFFLKPLGERPPERGPKYEERTRYLAKASEEVYSDDASQELKLSPPPSQVIEGRVVYADTNQPAGHARLTAYARQIEFGSMVGVPGRADGNGRFRLNPYPGKFFDVTAYPPNGQPYLILQKTVTWPEKAASQAVEMALPRGVLVRGKITEDVSGKAVEGAAVQYYPHANNTHVREAVLTGWQGTVISDGGGMFQIAVSPGKGTLLVHGPTPDYVQQIIGSNEIYYGQAGGRRYYVHASVPLNLDPDAKAPEVTVSLRPGIAVRGRLVGPAGKVMDETLMLTSFYVSPLNVNYRALPVHLREGEFELPGCHPEEGTSVYFLDPKNRLGAVVKVSGRSAGDQALEVRLTPCGTATTRFVDTEGKPLVDFQPGLKIMMTPGVGTFRPPAGGGGGEWWADEDFVANFDRLNHWDGPRTDQQGRCTFPALIPGATYRLDVFDKAASKWVTQDFSVRSGETLQLSEMVIKRPE